MMGIRIHFLKFPATNQFLHGFSRCLLHQDVIFLKEAKQIIKVSGSTLEKNIIIKTVNLKLGPNFS